MANLALICGAAGFIGSYSISAFQEVGWKVVGAGRSFSLCLPQYPKNIPFIKGDFEDPAYISDLLTKTNPNRLIFLAGPSDIQGSITDPVKDFRDQMLPLIQLLWAVSRMSKPTGVLLVSSAAVYGNATALPVTENEPTKPISPYGFHKLGQESLLDEFGILYGIPTCKVRVFSTYGRGQRKLAIWDITRRALTGNYKLFGTGEETRDYLHVRDVARALVSIATQAPFQGEVINVASGKESSMAEVAKLIYEILGISVAPTFGMKCLAGSPIRWRADVSYLQKLGFEQHINFYEGIRDTVEWIKNYV